MSRANRDQFNRDMEQSDSEAIEVVGVQDEEIEPVDEDSGEDLDQNLQNDYQQIDELDQYEKGSQDEEEYSQIDEDQRRQAEEALRERDLLRNRGRGRRNMDLLDGLDDEESSQEQQRRLDDRINRYQFDNDLDQDDDQDEQIDTEDEEEEKFNEERYLDKAKAKGKLAEWISEPRTVRYIKIYFKRFLRTFKKAGTDQKYYMQKLKTMCDTNKSSLEVEFMDISSTDYMQTILVWILFEPTHILPIMNKVLKEVVLKQYPDHENITSSYFIKIVNINYMDKLRELRHKNIGNLIVVQGVITKRSAVYNQLIEYYWQCNRCDETLGPFVDENPDAKKVGKCIHCQSNGPYTLHKPTSIYRNYQKVTLQETPGTVPAGRVPTQKEVVLLGDNIDVARPGDEVIVTGVYTYRYDFILNVKHGFPIFSTCIEANNIQCLAHIENIKIGTQELKEIEKWSQHPNIKNIIINSIAPSIHGHKHVKAGLALAMFGGESKDVGGKHRTRGDINVLLMGDPGVAKSQFLKSVQKTFTRTVYTTGKGATAVGLTASVKRDTDTKEWTLEGGALVLADQGICLIDEFDKMNDYDRTSIHEAMEQQSISISKAGIVANLQARCSVVAAANPKTGRYESAKSFMENVDLTDPIVSRFDVLCVVKDEVDIENDQRLSTFVINSHIKSHPKFHAVTKLSEEEYKNLEVVQENAMEEENQEKMQQQELSLEKDILESILLQDIHESEKEQKMPLEILKKYIVHARSFHPKITSLEGDKIKQFYVELRQQSQQMGGIPIAVRHIESIIRMAEAFAKMSLRNEVLNDDVDMAISVMLKSFISSQKFVIAQQLEKSFNKYLIKDQDNFDLLSKVLSDLMVAKQRVQTNYDAKVAIPVATLQNRAQTKHNIGNIHAYLQSDKFKSLYEQVGETIQLKQTAGQILDQE